MKLTKYGHACVVLEEQGKKVVIDPGAFTPEFGDLSNIVAVVVTHVHGDHFSPEHLQAILSKNPEAKIFTTPEVTEQFDHPNVEIAQAGVEMAAGPFDLRFYGEWHATIHEDFPRLHNIAVLVNDAFFHPGDSYTQPEQPPKVLGVPSNAPWMKVSESMEYIDKIKPEVCVPLHNGLLSETGNNIYNNLLQQTCADNNVMFEYLLPGASIEI